MVGWSDGHGLQGGNGVLQTAVSTRGEAGRRLVSELFADYSAQPRRYKQAIQSGG